MNIDQISPSILHVTAKENLNIEHDLTQQSDKTIAELIDEEKTKNQKESETTTNS
jgi:hypothetical protein